MPPSANPFSFQGRIDRGRYFIIGAFLTALKYFIDTTISAVFRQPWHVWNYFVPPTDASVFTLSGPLAKLYLILWAVSIPFFWIGIALTLRRLRDAGFRAGWVFLFFAPVANILFFLLLSFAPSVSFQEQQSTAAEDTDALPRGRAPIFGVVLAALLGVGLVILSTHFLGQYAWGLFLGVPFVIGFVASWFYNSGSLHTRGQTTVVCMLTTLLIGFTLIGFRMEGLICLLMALPLALPFAIAGGLAAHYCLTGSASRRPPNLSIATSVAVFPLLLLAEHAANPVPAIRPVVTSIVIAAPASVVWKNVIAFPPLAPPSEFLFRAGIAYPIGATITGSGPGAIRRCRFSTGDFVEPITVWDEDHLLAFNVTAEPPSLHEIGFGEIHTPHNDGNYMRSQHGQFKLTAIDAHHTLLEGTTWYQDYFWPQVYWRGWSDAIVHRIHLRVLEHIRTQAETQAQ